MADTETTVVIVAGSDQTVSGLALARSSDGAFASEVALRVNSAPVGSTNYLPTQDINAGKALGVGFVHSISTSVSIGIASTPIIVPPGATALTVTTAGPADVWINPINGGTAVLNQGYCAGGGRGGVSFGVGGVPMVSGTISAIVNAGTAQLLALAGG